MAMVSKEDKLSIRQQCLLLGLCRTSLYYTPSEETPENLEIMRLLDRQYAITPLRPLPTRRPTSTLTC